MPRGAKPGERRGGRAKGTPNLSTRELRASIQADASKYKQWLEDIAGNDDEPGNFRVMAIRELLDRGYGKPAQQIKATGDGAGRFDWDKVPIEKLREDHETLRLAQRDGIVIDHE